jgi:hypothetical protein
MHNFNSLDTFRSRVRVLTARTSEKKHQRVTLHCGMKKCDKSRKNNAAFRLEGGTVNCGLIPPFPLPNRRAVKPDAPPWLYADNLLILVCFLDPGQRSHAAFAKRDSLLAGSLAKRLCQTNHEDKQNRQAFA